MHPLICQYVGFQEVEIQPEADGGARATFMLKSEAHNKFGHVSIHWQRLGDFFVSTASVQLKDGEAMPDLADAECDPSRSCTS